MYHGISRGVFFRIYKQFIVNYFAIYEKALIGLTKKKNENKRWNQCVA